jgi:hypothetical protein
MEVSDCLWNPPNCPRIQVPVTCDGCTSCNSFAGTYEFVPVSSDLIETHYTDKPAVSQPYLVSLAFSFLRQCIRPRRPPTLSS